MVVDAWSLTDDEIEVDRDLRHKCTGRGVQDDRNSASVAKAENEAVRRDIGGSEAQAAVHQSTERGRILAAADLLDEGGHMTAPPGKLLTSVLVGSVYNPAGPDEAVGCDGLGRSHVAGRDRP